MLMIARNASLPLRQDSARACQLMNKMPFRFFMSALTLLTVISSQKLMGRWQTTGPFTEAHQGSIIRYLATTNRLLDNHMSEEQSVLATVGQGLTVSLNA